MAKNKKCPFVVLRGDGLWSILYSENGGKYWRPGFTTGSVQQGFPTSDAAIKAGEEKGWRYVGPVFAPVVRRRPVQKTQKLYRYMVSFDRTPEEDFQDQEASDGERIQQLQKELQEAFDEGHLSGNFKILSVEVVEE